ncbi:hypothetical protein [Streptomyces jumonjinensis]|uniref:hypothetical protein n=1 Tax=Streptomyces jumonjinensis TaxID=1945 RepID=UPI0037A535EB
MTSGWPPRSSDGAGLLAAYTSVLGWPLYANRVPVAKWGAAAVRDGSRCGVWSTLCADRFDAVRVPADAGRETVLLLERDEGLERAGVVVPCLVAGASRFFFVRAGTGHMVRNVEVLSGQQRVTLPPTGGFRWEAPPWSLDERRGLELPDAQVLVPWLRIPADPPDRS